MYRLRPALAAALLAVVLSAAVVAAGCAGAGRAPASGGSSSSDGSSALSGSVAPGERSPAEPLPAVGGWEELPRGPLGPRHGATAVWTGHEVLVLGGDDARPCPPSASCTHPETPALRDGAAFDPASRSWRLIAPAPVPLEWVQAIAVGDTVYVWSAAASGRIGSEAALLALDVANNRWRRLAVPDASGWYRVVVAREHVVAFSTSDEQGARPDLIYDAGSDTWSELPDDPLPASFDRDLIWDGSRLLLFAHELVPNPGSERPSLTLAAAYDLDSQRWQRLPDSEILWSPYVLAGELLVGPTLGSADGGQVNNWGRRYPYGGMLDVTSDTWLPLPEHPLGDRDDVFSAGVVWADGAWYGYGASAGWVLDLRTRSWIEIADRGERPQGEAVVAAGQALFAFGGARWHDGYSRAELLANAALWTPPPVEP